MQDDASHRLSSRLVLDDADLLPDWVDDWLVHDRERLHQLRLHVLEALADRLAGDGRYGLALDVALAALRSDTLRESAHRTSSAGIVHAAGERYQPSRGTERLTASRRPDSARL
jgi:DNA-binding SARP family transcriptional activator